MKKLGERLVEAGLVTKEAVEQALQQQRITGRKLGDCLVEIGLLQEAALLRFLAAEFNTRFVSADKLAKAKIPHDVLDKVPVRMAEAQNVLPLAFDPERRILSIVAAEPQNKAMLDELALVAQVDEVYPYVALRSAIAAAIKKHYYGDPTAFTSLFAPVPPSSAMASTYEGARGDTRNGTGPALRSDTDPRARGSSVSRQSGQLREVLGLSHTAFSESDLIETLQVMVNLLESGRASMRGHTAQLARQATMVARRLGLPPREVSHVAIAAYLHDLGKRPDRHCTLMSNAANADWKNDARRSLRAPVKLFESVHLPMQVNAILAQLFEAWDGTGVPNGARGDDIPMGARIIATVDAWLDLTKNPGNGLGKVLGKSDALAELQARSGTLFDPRVVDAFGSVLSGELLRQRVETDGRQLLIADPDEGTRTDLIEVAARLGLVSRGVSTLDAAVDAILTGEADVMVLGIAFGSADLATIVHYLRSQPDLASAPILVSGEFADAAARDRALQLGVDAIVSSPVVPAEASAALESAWRSRLESGGPGRVVKGSFDELPAADLYRALAAGRKSGRVTFRFDAKEGFIQFEKGRLVYAAQGQELGESALHILTGLTHAEFQYDPESLLTEMPQLDKDLELVAQLVAGVAA